MMIKTPSRLHMTLIDLNGSYGRFDGGVGLTLANPHFILKSEETEKGITIGFDDNITNPEILDECITKISNSAERVINHFNIESGFHFQVKQAYFPHSGLGSGTQISLATGKLICEHIGQNILSPNLGAIVGRGGTSGIGTFSFDLGGFIADGGHSSKEKSTFLPSSASGARPPHLIGQYDFPEDWNILIALPSADNSVTGNKEVNIFQHYCPVPKSEVEQVSHVVFMNLIPYLLEHDIENFGASIDMIQTRGFKKIEVSLQPPKLVNLMNFMRDNGAYGVGMSSFGPVTYTVYDKSNKDIVKATEEYLDGDGIVITTKAQNHGYELTK